MKRKKIDWRFRKKIAGGDPVIPLPCGCKKWADDGQTIRWCEAHAPIPAGEPQGGDQEGVAS